MDFRAPVIIVSEAGFPTGGGYKVAIQSAVALAKLGLQVGFFTADTGVDSTLLEAGVTCAAIGEKSFFEVGKKEKLGRLVRNENAAAAFSKFLDAYPADTIVHVHTYSLKLTGSVIKVALDRGFRVVITLHDYITVCPISILYNYRSQEICMLKPMSAACWASECTGTNRRAKAVRLLHARYNEKVVRIRERVQDFIFVSEYCREIAESRGEFQGRKHVLANPQDLLGMARNERPC